MMETTKMNVKEWLEAFNAGRYNSSDLDTQIEAGWYDWFCSDESLKNRTKTLGAKLKKIVAITGKFNSEKCSVFFKNNCPISGGTYDSIGICDIESDEMIYSVIPKHSRDGNAIVYGAETDFESALVEGTWQDVLDWFDTKTAEELAAERKAKAERKEKAEMKANLVKMIELKQAAMMKITAEIDELHSKLMSL